MAAGKSAAANVAEAAKCVLVCANCHGEIERRLIASPPPGARYGESWQAATARHREAPLSPMPSPSRQLRLAV